MHVTGKFVASEVKETERGQKLTLVDLEHGGQITLSSKDVHYDLKDGQIVNGNINIKGGIGKFGPYLQLLDGTLTKI